MTTTTTQITTDFALEQDLSFITKGLSARAMVSWDNTFVEWKRGIMTYITTHNINGLIRIQGRSVIKVV